MTYTTHDLPRREDFSTDEEFYRAQDLWYGQDNNDLTQITQWQKIINHHSLHRRGSV